MLVEIMGKQRRCMQSVSTGESKPQVLNYFNH